MRTRNLPFAVHESIKLQNFTALSLQHDNTICYIYNYDNRI
jgi:hypothetical protein